MSPPPALSRNHPSRLTWTSGSHWAELRAWERAQRRQRARDAALTVLGIAALVVVLIEVLS
jgi:hypothetical protein